MQVFKTSTLYIDGLKQPTHARGDIFHFFFRSSHIAAPLFFTFVLGSFLFCFAPDIHQTAAIIVFERHFRQLKGREHNINGPRFVFPFLFSPGLPSSLPTERVSSSPSPALRFLLAVSLQDTAQ